MKERYESYKDSGVPWIGQVPAGWEVVRQKYLIQLINGRAFADSEFEENGKYRILRVGNIFSNPKWYTSSLELPPDKYCDNGDLLYAWSMSYAPIIWRGEKVIYHYHIWKTKLSERINKEFAYYYFIALTKALRANVHETTMGFVTMQSMNNTWVPLPPLPEQRAIAGYLDARCAAIDAYVASLEREANLALELKQAVIARAVTRGLDPNAPMRDSGIPWIGQMPQGWEVVRVKHYLKITNGCDPTTEGDVPVYGSGSTSFKTCGEYKKGPTVLLGRKGTINIPQYVEGKYWNVDTAFDVKSKGGFDLKLFYYMATCFDYESYMTQTAVPSMAQSDYNNIKIPLPPLPEQRVIAGYLDARCAAIDAYVSSLEREAALARELKAREIADAVTGKVKITA